MTSTITKSTVGSPQKTRSGRPPRYEGPCGAGTSTARPAGGHPSARRGAGSSPPRPDRRTGLNSRARGPGQERPDDDDEPDHQHDTEPVPEEMNKRAGPDRSCVSLTSVTTTSLSTDALAEPHACGHPCGLRLRHRQGLRIAPLAKRRRHTPAGFTETTEQSFRMALAVRATARPAAPNGGYRTSVLSRPSQCVIVITLTGQSAMPRLRRSRYSPTMTQSRRRT